MDESSFWHSISIFLTNYHVVNRKLFACLIEEVHKQSNNTESPCSEDDLLEHLRNYTALNDNSGYRIAFKFLSKHLEADIKATGLIDFSNTSYTCKFIGNTFDDFCITYRDNDVDIKVEGPNGDDSKNNRWANFVLKPKLLNWSKKIPGQNAGRSLRLIDLEYYNKSYKELKQKYSDKVLKFWSEAKESTDPLKFIYEDLAIAAYLISLWRHADDGKSMPKAFADLGCGNGLLVYILNEEGFDGYGYDVRARKIWSHYPAATKLLEQSVDPKTFQLPPHVDWLIGNHSDELSPWVPVMAALGSYEMKYFLLPCCGYEFNGAKFQRRNSRVSAYQDMYGYLLEISQHCGFRTLEDRLKIPSTKRLALIGLQREYTPEEYAPRQQCVLDYVQRQSANDVVKLREPVERVRNCTQLDRGVLNALVLKIFNALLAATSNKRDHNGSWASGGTMRMPEIVQKLSKEDLQHIKSECGGIKTLLRNKHEIFEFCGGDAIRIRRPMVASALSVKQTVKKRLCFFKENHPHGCPLNDNECTFIH